VEVVAQCKVKVLEYLEGKESAVVFYTYFSGCLAIGQEFVDLSDSRFEEVNYRIEPEDRPQQFYQKHIDAMPLPDVGEFVFEYLLLLIRVQLS
jgi:hypothetical protein